jgi:hypothetical protein
MTVASTFLPVFRKNALHENERLVPLLSSGSGLPADALALCLHYRVAAVSSLLLSASADDFHRHLRKSAMAFTWYTASHATGISLARALPPILDALCTGDMGPATAIARQVGPHYWDSRSEYEEDFLYARFLCLHFLESSDTDEELRLVERYASLVGTSEEPRLTLIKAFVGADEHLFEQGLEQLLTERNARYQRLAAKEQVPLWELATVGAVSIEGLALVALAERVGFRTRSDYLHVPSLARLPAPPLGRPVDWQDIRG